MLEKPKKTKSTILGGIIIGIVTGLPIISTLNTCLCCGGVVLCGLCSIYLYKKEFNEETKPLESSDALIVGVVAGLYGALFSVLISVAFYMVLGPITEKFLHAFLVSIISQRNMSVEMADWFDRAIYSLEKFIDEGITVNWVLFNLFVNVILYPIFSMIGALIGYGVLNIRKEKQ